MYLLIRCESDLLERNIPIEHFKVIASITTLPTRVKWAIIMLGGGHFAAAVFKGKEVVVHKTFHRSGLSSQNQSDTLLAPRNNLKKT